MINHLFVSPDRNNKIGPGSPLPRKKQVEVASSPYLQVNGNPEQRKEGGNGPFSAPALLRTEAARREERRDHVARRIGANSAGAQRKGRQDRPQTGQPRSSSSQNHREFTRE